MRIPAPTGPNNKQNRYYSSWFRTRLAKIDYSRTKFFGTIRGVPDASFAVNIEGLVDDPTYGPTPHIGVELSYTTDLVQTVTSQRWFVGGVQKTTTATYTPVAADDGLPLYVEVDTDTPETGRSSTYTVRYAPSVSFEMRTEEGEVVTQIEPSDDPIVININGTTYTERVTDRATLTGNMIIASPTPLTRPVKSGTFEVGQLITTTPALWMYTGDYPGDPTFQHQRNGVDILGATSKDYTAVMADSGTDNSVIETFGGQTIASDPVAIVGPPISLTLVQVSDIEGLGDPLVFSVNVGAAATNKTTLLMLAGLLGDSGTSGHQLRHIVTGTLCTEVDAIRKLPGNGDACIAFELDTSDLSGVQDFRLEVNGTTPLDTGLVAYTFTDKSSHTFYHAHVNSGPAGVSIDVPQGAALVAVGHNINSFDDGNGGTVWIGITEDADYDMRTGEFFSTAYLTDLSAETGRIVSAQSNNNGRQLMLVALVE